MGMKYDGREGSLGATVDTWVALTTKGSDTTPGPLQVPPGKTRIKQVLFSNGDNTPTGAAIGTNIVVKLVGAFTEAAEQQIVLDGYNVIWATAGAGGAPSRMIKKDVDWAVKPNEIITIYGLATGGTCAGSPEVSLFLGFA